MNGTTRKSSENGEIGDTKPYITSFWGELRLHCSTVQCVVTPFRNVSSFDFLTITFRKSSFKPCEAFVKLELN